MRLFILITALTIFWSSCGQAVIQRTETGEYYTEKYSLRKKDQVKHGPYQKFTLDGTLLEEGTYVDGQLHGELKKYIAGKIASIETMEMGVYQGLYQSFYPDGGVNSVGIYEQDKMVGVWKRYYKNGQLMEEVSFEGNLENGPFKEYYENGNIKAEGTYRNGDFEHGELLLYNEQGELIRKMDCKEGICRTTWEIGTPEQ